MCIISTTQILKNIRFFALPLLLLTEYISTRWYRAPECLLTDGYYNYKMDMWGVGCVFFEVISLFPLFPGQNEASTFFTLFSNCVAIFFPYHCALLLLYELKLSNCYFKIC